ncbi:MAG: hypothetical protein OSB69_10480 [Alphaproteobacteria bacterium]|nr:hypothetical protein [Alphaproteobacteria bacterium]
MANILYFPNIVKVIEDCPMLEIAREYLSALKLSDYRGDVTRHCGPHAFVQGTQNTKFVEDPVAVQYSKDLEFAERLLSSHRWSHNNVATRIMAGPYTVITLEWTLDIHKIGHAPECAPFDSLQEIIRPTPDLAKR